MWYALLLLALATSGCQTAAAAPCDAVIYGTRYTAVTEVLTPDLAWHTVQSFTVADGDIAEFLESGKITRLPKFSIVAVRTVP